MTITIDDIKATIEVIFKQRVATLIQVGTKGRVLFCVKNSELEAPRKRVFGSAVFTLEDEEELEESPFDSETNITSLVAIEGRLAQNKWTTPSGENREYYYLKAIEKNKEEYNAWYNLACVYALMDDFDNAFSCFEYIKYNKHSYLETTKEDADLVKLRLDKRYKELFTLK